MTGAFDDWLSELGLGRYATVFAEQRVDFDVLASLTDADLKELGLPLGDRRRLLQAVAVAGQPDTAPAGAMPQPIAAAGERRQVTILFADISGFTRFSSARDAEETHALLNRFFAAVDAVVQGFGGTVDKHIGDAVMAVFGAPVAHSDDPERALRAALGIHQAVAVLEPPLQVHIGVASGQVVASRTGSAAHVEYTVTGDTVNLAARLTDLAEAGETLASATVRDSLGERLSAESLGQRLLQGIPEPVEIWRVNALADRGAGRRRRLVGRQQELQRIAQALDECVDVGSGTTIVLRGEAGIGKTHLLEAVQALAADRGYRCHAALSLDFGVGVGQDAARAMVCSLLDVPLQAAADERRQAVEQALQAGLLVPHQLVHVNALLDLEQSDEQRANYEAMDRSSRDLGEREAVAALVAGLATTAPRLLTVEDIHWAGGHELAHLAALAATTTASPAVLVLTTRIEGDPLDHAWHGSAAGAELRLLDLQPLATTEARDLANDFGGLSEQLVEACIDRSGGNPLFLEQLLATAGEASGPEDVPGSVQSVVQSRVDALTPRDRSALQVAAVLGQRFGMDVLRHVAGDPHYSPDGLLRHALIRPSGDEFLFAHALIRDAVHASLLKQRRRDLHQAAAAWFAGRDPVLHAGHLELAGDSGAAAAYASAAQTLAGNYQYEQAYALAQRGLALDPDTPTRFGLICQSAGVLLELGRPEDSLAAYGDALDYAVGSAEVCRANLGRAQAMRLLDRYDEGLAALQRAEAAANEVAAGPELAQIHHLRGNFCFPLGRIDDCLASHRRAVELSRMHDLPELEAAATVGLVDANYMRGRAVTVGRQLDRSLALVRSQGLRRAEATQLYMRSSVRTQMLQLDGAIRDAEACVDIAGAIADRRSEQMGHQVWGYALVYRGDYAAACTQLRRCAEIGEEIGTGRLIALALCLLAEAEYRSGDPAAGRATARRAVALSRESAATFCVPVGLGALALTTKDAEEQSAALREAEEILAPGNCVSHNYFDFYRMAIDVALANGDDAAALHYADVLTAYTVHEAVPVADYFSAWARALAVRQAGPDGETTSALQTLRETARRLGIGLALPRLDAALTASD